MIDFLNKIGDSISHFFFESFPDFVEGFMNIFKLGGDQFVSFVSSVIPMLIVMLTFFNALIGLIGEKRVNRFTQKIAKYAIFRYTLLPVLSVLLLTSPMCFSTGSFLEEKYKPAFYDATVSFVHPVLGLFPHANAAEIFVYTGVVAGVESLGFPAAQLAVRYFLVGLIVVFLRGIVTEQITKYFMKRKKPLVEEQPV